MRLSGLEEGEDGHENSESGESTVSDNRHARSFSGVPKRRS